MDRFTGFIRVRALKSITAEDAAHTLFFSWVRDFGCPRVLLSDQGAQFKSATFTNLCKLLGIDKRRTTAYYPECNGRIERMHRVLKEMLATKVIDHPNWLHLLPLCEFLINTAINKFGVSPAMLVFGEQPVLPHMFFKDLLLEEP